MFDKGWDRGDNTQWCMLDVAGDGEFYKGGITPSEYTGQGRLHTSLFHIEFCTSLNV